MSNKIEKERTSITINPDLFKQGKEECKRRLVEEGKRTSFSELVEEALRQYLGG